MPDTRQSIIESAIIIFNEDLSAPLEKVAEEAGTTRRTLHRYFKDRDELMQACKKEIRKACYLAMEKGYNSTTDPVKRLEYMFYAGIECGTKDTFLHKLHTMHDHAHQKHDEESNRYDNTFSLWKSHLAELQKLGYISPMMTIEWIHHFFQGIVSASVTSRNIQRIQLDEVKKLSWFSFSRGIGL